MTVTFPKFTFDGNSLQYVTTFKYLGHRCAVYDYQIEPMLRKVKCTAPGLDNLPLWSVSYTHLTLPTIYSV